MYILSCLLVLFLFMFLSLYWYGLLWDCMSPNMLFIWVSTLCVKWLHDANWKKNVSPLCLGFQVRVSLYSPWLSWNSLLDQAGFRLSDPLVSASFALGLKVWSNLVSWSFIDSELILQVVRASQHNFGIKLGGYWKIHVKHSFNFTCVIKQLQAKHMF